MNSVLRSAILTICPNTEGWETPGSGTIIRPRVVIIDSEGTVIEEVFKAKRWVEKASLRRGVSPWSDQLSSSTLLALGLKVEPLDPYHNLDQKIADLYSEIRAFLLCFATRSQLRKDDVVISIISLIRRLYLEQVKRGLEDYPNGEYSGNLHLELDMRRSAGDRLAVVWTSSKEVTDAII